MFSFGVLIVALTASSCASPRFEGRPDLTVFDNKPLPEPVRQDLVIPSRPYVIGPSDQLSIDVFGIDELSKNVTVDLTGQIALPLVGSLKVSGMTADELTADLVSRLRRAYVRKPQVTVNIVTAASQVITVDGSVTTPGIYPLLGRMSLMRAIARASGTSEFARENYVVVFRNVNSKRYAALYDLRAIRQGIYEDPEIFSNDVIYVGDDPARRLFRDVIAAAPLLSAPLIYLVTQ
ncbi:MULTISPECIES: polysaccharide biosynthesis/export family protein [unclassified Sphingomonas]|uniref:polysaccharide biosynthesis/export family protein n=1 Tax=unclassified Sphingomonas TaxID=196159 RepID=UPI001F2A4D36|nr:MULTISPECIES: polysaccharide biosynthesis/export family protein [unclassified Sphingomonas]